MLFVPIRFNDFVFTKSYFILFSLIHVIYPTPAIDSGNMSASEEINMFWWLLLKEKNEGKGWTFSSDSLVFSKLELLFSANC